MKKLFKLEEFTASTVTLMRSDSMLLILAFVFLLAITPATALQVSKSITKGFAEVFTILIEYKLIRKETVPKIALVIGLLLAITVESAGFIFATRGKHLLGLAFSGSSSAAAFVNFLHTFAYGDDKWIVDLFFSVFICASPCAIIYIIGYEFANKLNYNTSSITTYSGAASSKISEAITYVISKINLTKK
jgi:hypothetical protein